MSTKGRGFLVSAAVATILALALPARAQNVTVYLSVNYSGFASAQGQTVAGLCPVSVPANGNGGDVLDAAVSEGCITSWSWTTFPSVTGRFVTCISGVCAGAHPPDALCWYWIIHENGPPADTGIDGYQAADGDSYAFSFDPLWVAALGC